MKKLFYWMLLILFISQLSCTLKNQENWMQFRGHNLSGIAQEAVNPPIHFNVDSNVHWKVDVPSGWSSPCIFNKKIFITGFGESDSLLYIFAINRQNGEYLWKDSIQPTSCFPIHALHNYASPTIACDGKKIFASFPNHGLLAYDLNGNRLWDYKHELVNSFYFSGSSPVVKDSMVILLVNSEEEPRIFAHDCETGDTLWSISAKDNQWENMSSSATPVISGNTMVMHFRQAIVAYDLQTQSPEWWIAVPTMGVATPVIDNDILYLNTWIQGGETKERGGNHTFTELLELCDTNSNGTIERKELKDDLYWFKRSEILDVPRSSISYKSYFGRTDTNKDKSIDEKEWNTVLDFVSTYFEDHGMLAISMDGKGERQVQEIDWKVNQDTPETPSPLIVGENVVFIKDGGTMTILNRESGNVIHKKRIGASGGYLSSPILAGDKIITCSYNGTVTIISAEDYQVLGQNKLKEKIGASPTIVDDILYIRTSNHLYAFKE